MKIKILLLFLLAPVIIFAQNYTLDELLGLAMENNTTLKQSQINLDISRARLHSARINYLPDLSAGLSRNEIIKYDTRYDRLHGSDSLSTTADNAYFTISKSIALNNVSYFSNKDASHNYTLATIANEMQIQDILYRIINSYITVLENQKRIELQERNIIVQENIVSESRSLYRQNKITQTQLQQSEINLLNARISLLNAQNTLSINRTRLFDLVNVDDEEKDFDEVNIYTEDSDFQRELNIDQIYRVREQEETVNKLRTSIQSTKLDFLPQLNLQYRFNRNLDSNEYRTDGNTSHTIGLSLSYSLNSVFRNHYSYKIDRLLQDQNSLKTSQLIRDITLEYNQYLEELNYLQQLDILLESRMQQAIENLAIAQQRYRLGLETQLDLERANYENLEAQKAREDNHYQLIRTKLNIDNLLSNRLYEY